MTKGGLYKTSKHDWMRWKKDQASHRQIFQLQLSYGVVRFHILCDQSKSEICVFKYSLPLLSLRPILSTLYLYIHTHFFIITTQHTPHTHNPCTHSICMHCRQVFKVSMCIHVADTGTVSVSLTEPFSITRFSITTPRQRCSHTISQKWPQVFGNGP